MITMESIIQTEDAIQISGYIEGNKENVFSLVLDRKTMDIISCNKPLDDYYIRKTKVFIKRTLEKNCSLPDQYVLAWY